MIYILEGPNGAGKTTLAKYLIENYGLAYHKDIAKDLSMLPVEYRASATKEAILAQARVFVSLAEKCDFVVDRFHMTEYVYGTVMRRYSVNYMPEVDLLLNKAGKNILLVYLTDSTENLMARSGLDNPGIIGTYQYLFEKSNLNKTHIPTLNIGAKEVVRRLGLEYKNTQFVFTEGKGVV